MMDITVMKTTRLKDCDHCNTRCLSYLARWPGRARQIWRRCTCCGGNAFERNHRWLPHTVLQPCGVTFEDLPVENNESEIQPVLVTS